MKRILCAFTLVCVCAFAGKAERQFKLENVDPAVKKAVADFKAACDCTLTVKIADNVSDERSMGNAVNILRDIYEHAKGYCTDGASKKAVCKMKTLEINKGDTTKFSFSGDRGVASTDGQSYVSFDMMTAELDK
jgi:hypothetical protein